MQELKVSSLTELLAFQESLEPTKFYCFRGQSIYYWDLVPSLYRRVEKFHPPANNVTDGYGIGEIERDLYREFERSGRRFTHSKWDISNQWHQLFLA